MLPMCTSRDDRLISQTAQVPRTEGSAFSFLWGFLGASVVTQMVKNLPAMQETQVQYRGPEDPLEKEMATHSSVLPGEAHGQRSLVG